MGRILSIEEFLAAYPNEEACWDKLVKARWPQGYRCVKCGHGVASFIQTRKLFQCSACRHQCSVTAGTVLQDTKLPLRTWFWAMFFYATTKKSVSAMELQRKLGLGSYETAWLLHRKIQHAFRKVNRKLRGLVEVDEVFIGPVSRKKYGRGTDKVPVAVAVEERGRYAGRMAAEPVASAGGEHLLPFVQEHVEAGTTMRPGTIVKTDGWAGYQGLDALGYQHAPEVEGDPKRASIVLPRVHIIAGNLKRVIEGTHGGTVSSKHLPGFTSEFSFRFNHRGWLEKALDCTLRRVVQAAPKPYKVFVG